MILVEKTELLDEVFEKYFQKGTWSNNYILKDEYFEHIENQKLFYIQDDQNSYFLIKKNSFYRLYYFINEPNTFFSALTDLPVVLEILYRGEKHFPSNQSDFWIQSGFKSHLTRDCYFLKNRDLTNFDGIHDLNIQNAQTQEEFEYVKKLIDQDLDLYTGDNLTIDEIRDFARQNLLYISYMEGKPCGFLQSDDKNQVYWLGHIVVDSEFRGKGIAKSLVNHYLNEGKSRNCNQFQLWVIHDNKPAVELYKKYGFTYLNKSTCSMLKK
jgi:ribosomal protein S18 acetylase RimI-like enzyme